MLNSHLEINEISFPLVAAEGGGELEAGGVIFFFPYQFAAFFKHVYQINEILTLLDEGRWILHLKITC